MIIANSPILPWNEPNIRQTPAATGVYALRDSRQTITYIGRTTAPRRLRDRIMDHWNTGDVPGVAFFDWYQMDSEESAAAMEADGIRKYQPRYNVLGR